MQGSSSIKPGSRQAARAGADRRLQALERECSTTSRRGPGSAVVPFARKRVGPLEVGKRNPPDFDQQFDPFGETIYNKADFWEANFYDEPDETSIDVYVENLRKSAVIDKHKAEQTKIERVKSSQLADELSNSQNSLQIVFAHLTWCRGTKALLPQFDAWAWSVSDADFYQVTLESEASRGSHSHSSKGLGSSDATLLDDVWLSPTIKFFRKTEEVGQLVNPSLDELKQLMQDRFSDHLN